MAGTLRITGGALVRRRFQVPKAADEGLVRPTSDRVREAVFSSLGSQIEDARVLDLFAGSGAYGFESISRGAKSAMFVEMSRTTADCVKANMASLGIADQCRLTLDDATRFIRRAPGHTFDVLFVDPPYTLTLNAEFWQNLLPWVGEESVVIFRCHKQEDFLLPAGYELLRDRSYGGTAVFFLSKIIS